MILYDRNRVLIAMKTAINHKKVKGGGVSWGVMTMVMVVVGGEG